MPSTSTNVGNKNSNDAAVPVQPAALPSTASADMGPPEPVQPATLPSASSADMGPPEPVPGPSYAVNENLQNLENKHKQARFWGPVSYQRDPINNSNEKDYISYFMLMLESMMRKLPEDQIHSVQVGMLGIMRQVDRLPENGSEDEEMEEVVPLCPREYDFVPIRIPARPEQTNEFGDQVPNEGEAAFEQQASQDETQPGPSRINEDAPMATTSSAHHVVPMLQGNQNENNDSGSDAE